jgi:hypothetical protein
VLQVDGVSHGVGLRNGRDPMELLAWSGCPSQLGRKPVIRLSSLLNGSERD